MSFSMCVGPIGVLTSFKDFQNGKDTPGRMESTPSATYCVAEGACLGVSRYCIGVFRNGVRNGVSLAGLISCL